MKLLKIALLFSLSLTLHSKEFSMRKCMVLPVTDNLGGALGFKVFEKLENHLKESRWCYYKSNSQILGILQNYREDLKNHLNNPEVIRTVANKVRSGTIIKTNLEHNSKGTIIDLQILGQNGISRLSLPF